jgi:Zn-dependent protease with chaperone function
VSRQRSHRGVSLLVFLTSGTTVRMYFCLFALAAAATTMGGVWRDQLPVGDTYRRAAIAIGLTCLLGAAFYLLQPASRIRHRKLVHLGRVDGGQVSRRHRQWAMAYRPDVVDEVRDLAAVAGVDLHSVWMSLDDPRGTAVVFGRIGRRYLELKRGMVRRFDTDRASFRCIVNHELGHLHHRDVDLVYLPGALFLGFLTLISLSFSFFPGMPDRATEAGPAAQYFGFVVVAYLARNGVLREREYHADAFAVRQHRGEAGEAEAIMGRLLRREPTTMPSLWQRLIGAHPCNLSRADALDDVGQRPYAPLGDALMAGLLLTSTLPLLLAPGAAPGWPVFVLLALTGGGLAAAVWQFTQRNLPAWGPRRGLAHLAAFISALAVGLLAGYLTTPAATYGQPSLTAVAWWTPVTDSAPLGLALSAVGSVLMLFAASLAWQRMAGTPVPEVTRRAVAAPVVTPPTVELPHRVSAWGHSGRLVVVLLALILVGSMALAPLMMIRTQLADHGVVDPFTALIVAAMGCYLVSLARAVLAGARAAARGHRTLAMESLAAMFLLFVAGSVFLGKPFLNHAAASKAMSAGLLIGILVLVVGTVSWHAAGYAQDARRAFADWRAPEPRVHLPEAELADTVGHPLIHSSRCPGRAAVADTRCHECLPAAPVDPCSR